MKSSIPIPISSIETSYNLSSCSISSLKPFLSSCPSLVLFSLTLSHAPLCDSRAKSSLTNSSRHQRETGTRSVATPWVYFLM
ncbi:hypothetical protein I3843_04G110900 [Carya illinoinensis]|nr:hypothetical protein I3843_04G110900 [Carya illinoinensis]